LQLAGVCARTTDAALACMQAKGLFQQLQVPAKVIELDVIPGGDDLQLGVQEITGRPAAAV